MLKNQKKICLISKCQLSHKDIPDEPHVFGHNPDSLVDSNSIIDVDMYNK